MKPKILIIDDEPTILFGFSEYLASTGYEVKQANCLAEAQEAVNSQKFNAVVLDVRLPDGNGIEWISYLRNIYPDVAIIVITGHGNIPLAVEAMRRGADNFLTKPVDMSELDVFMQKSLEVSSLRRRELNYQRLSERFKPFFGKCAVMKRTLELAHIASNNDSPVLILGETGSGKGVLARWIHDHSSFNSSAFVEINCSGLKGEMLASELFGHVKGAFTSAIKDKQGLIEFADGGTLFLDEIGDMDFTLQSNILKVIEEKQYRRLGEIRVRNSNFRLICASNRDIQEETVMGNFRKDLYFRINVFPINVPPLRERMEDLQEIVQYIFNILGSYNISLSSEVLQLLKNYSWPGNFRELRNVLERAFLLSRGRPLSYEIISELVPVDTLSGPQSDEIVNLDKMEENYIKDTIERSGNDLNKAAKALKMSRATLYRRIKKFRENK